MSAALPILTTALYGTVGAIAFGFLYLAYRHYQLSSQRSGEAEISAGPIPYLGYALEFTKRPIELFQELAHKSQDILGIVIAGQRMFILHDAHSTGQLTRVQKGLSITEFHDTVSHNLFDYSKEVIHSPHVNYDLLRKFYSQYLLNDQCLNVLCNRMLNKFHQIYEIQVNQRLSLATAATATTAAASASANNTVLLSNGKAVVKLYDFIARFIFHVGLGAVFNHNINDTPEKCDSLYDAFVIFDASVAIAIGGIHISYFSKPFQALKYITSVFDQFNSDCSELIERRNQYFDEVALKDPHYKQIYGKLNFPVLWASVSNSMPATFWMIYHILQFSQKEELLQAIRVEIANKIPNSKQFYDTTFTTTTKQQQPFERDSITIEQLDSLHLIDSIFTETLRLMTGSFFMRVVVEDGYEIECSSGKKYKFRKGDRLGIFPPLFHLDEEIFPNAKEFNPYRFVLPEEAKVTVEERTAAAQGKIPMKKDGKDLNPSNIFLPFGAGIAYCPGRRFIRSEVKLLFLFLILNLDFELKDPKEKIGIDGTRAGVGVFPPAKDIEAYVTHRH